MKLLIVLAAVALVAARPEEDMGELDNFNISEILGNQRLMNANTKCFLGTGKCSPVALKIKKLIPQSMQNSCEVCTEKQKELVAKVIIAIQKKQAADWVELNKLYNPDGKYSETLEEFLKKYGQ